MEGRMNRIFLVLLIGSSVFATIPEAVITHTNAYNGYATIAGRLTSKPEAPVGVTIQNGGIAYSTVTDNEGRWAIVIGHRSITVDAQSYNLSNGKEVSKTTNSKIHEDRFSQH